MNLATLLIALNEMPRELAFGGISPLVVRESAVVGAAVITLLGVWLCWQAQDQQTSIEERAKDGDLTEEQARRRIRLVGWFGPAVAVIGVGLLCAAVKYAG